MEPGQNMPDDPPESSENGKPTEQESEASRPQPSAFPTPAQSLELGLKDFKVMLPVMPNLQQYALQKTGTIPAEPKVQTARKSFKRKPIKGQDTEGPSPHPRLNLNPREGVKVSGKILRFSCSECKGDTAFSPNDLMKHFQVAHQGFLPTYPCDMCNFTANDFSLLQQHRLRHRDTFVKCEICNDSIQYTLLQLTRHFGLYHSLNGNYRCEKCKFCTKDVGTFVQHIHRHGEVQYKCGKCPHVSFTKGEFQRHLVMHTGSFPFICQFCDYGATRKDYIIKHMSAMHSDEIERKCKWKEKDDGAKTLVDMSPGLKLLLKKNVAGVPRDAHWRTKGLHALSGGGLLDEYGRLSNPEKTLEETQQFLERSVVSEKDSAQWAKVRKNEQQYISPILPAVLHPMLESGFNSNTGLIKTGSNGSPMLMVKNKISIPPNCTTKFMGFKMVDGKKHLVLKVIPAAKLGTPQNVPSTVGKDTNGHLPEIHPEDINGANSDVASQSSSQSEPSNCAESGQSTLPGGSDLHQSGAESPAVKQSDEAEDLPSHATPHTADEEVESAVRQMNDDDEIPGVSVSPASSKVFHSSDQTMHRAPSPCEETGQPKEQTVSPDGTSLDTEKVTLTSEETELLRGEPADPVKESDDRLILNSSREEVFSFHNYSKDRTSDQSSDSLPSSEGGELCDTHNSESVQGVEDLPSGNVTPVEQLPPESQERRTEDETGDATTDQLSGHSDQSAMEKIPDSEIEVDECVAAVEEDAIWPPEAMDENADSTEMPKITSVFSLQSPKNSPKLGVSQLPDNGLETGSKASPVSEAPACPKNTEEVNQPAGEIGSPCRAAALGRILEEHSDAIISHQLEKERFGTANQDPAKHTATLRIIQPVGLTEGKKPVFLKPSQNGFAVPFQVGGSQGFKLITGSSIPQINVSYLKSGNERPKKAPGLAFTLNNGRMGTVSQIVGDKKVSDGAANTEVSKTLSPGEQKGTVSSAGHFIVNNMPLKGSLFLPNSVQSISGERTSNLQTCFLVQRPLPVVANASCHSSVPVNHGLQDQPTRPVLAVPISSPERPAVLQAGRQAFLLKCISPVKSGILLNSQTEGNIVNQSFQASDSGSNTVLLKIVRNSSDSSVGCGSGELNGIAALTATNQPIYLATGALQSPCILMSSNQSILNVSTGGKTPGPSQDCSINSLRVSQVLKHTSPTSVQGKAQEWEAGRGVSNTDKSKPASPARAGQDLAVIKRKRQRKRSQGDSSDSPSKAKRPPSKKAKEKQKGEAETPESFRGVEPKDVERTLRLSPFSRAQLIKCPRRNQPVVVLNHPDADLPEVANVMKTINKFKGHVLKVALSQRTVDALSESDAGPCKTTPAAISHASRKRRLKPPSPVKERYILKLRLKKMSRNKYKVVNSTSDRMERSSFSCWFCGRIFDNQEEWIGHGQRHLMEATRDWDTLF
ncbi:zinc finger protein 518A isoform X1 [Amia ocellicauda]|uniref:zinc finger protein 518A isoform X1 n=1 Tax=Amia ocellicauda TaxID=2972642 RepID=UPI0034640743